MIRTAAWVRLLASLVMTALTAAACGATSGTAPPTTTTSAAGANELVVAVASYDLAVGDDQRFIAGVLTPDAELVAFGELTMRFGYLGQQATGAAETTQEATAKFLPVPGLAPEGDAERPMVLTDTQGSGVYETTADFDRPGFWQVQVDATMADGTTRSGQAAFTVAAEHQVPAVGDEAPPSDNLTIGSGAPAVAIDSRAQGGGDVPDPHLHDTTIAAAVAAGRPVLVTFSTPVYCVSRFCGPITETVAELAEDYGDRAEFIHVEVWRDFEAGELNAAAAEWIQPADGSGGNEPWTFLIGADGRIAARWDNVASLAEMRAELERLPAA